MTSIGRPRRTFWVLALPDALPEAWADRGQPLVLVALTGAEVEMLERAAASGAVNPDAELIRLIAAGQTQDAAARRLGWSLRTVQRRLARLRAEHGVRSTSELVALLPRDGLGS